MKILIVAHPDDEILWFNPKDFDKIYVVFNDREDKPEMGDNRRKALEEHPLDITSFGLEESGYWRNPLKEEEYQQNYNDLIVRLKKLKGVKQVTTHGANGEYGHLDHKLCFNACMEVFDCPVNGKDPSMFRQIKDIYIRNKCWTWN